MSAERTAIDWRRVRDRLDRAGAWLARTVDDDAERVAAILEERRAALAAPPRNAATAAARARALVFGLAGERYALAIAALEAVVPVDAVTPLPDAAPEILGLASRRGEVVVVYDLARILDIRREAFEARGLGLILRDRRPRAALLVEQAFGAEALEEGGGAGPESLRDRGGLAMRITAAGVIVLDPEALSGRLAATPGETSA